MKKLFLIISMLFLLVSCNTSEDKIVNKGIDVLMTEEVDDLVNGGMSKEKALEHFYEEYGGEYKYIYCYKNENDKEDEKVVFKGLKHSFLYWPNHSNNIINCKAELYNIFDEEVKTGEWEGKYGNINISAK